MKESEYAIMTRDYAVAAATAFIDIERDATKGKFVFVFLSGRGANQANKGPMYAKYRVSILKHWFNPRFFDLEELNTVFPYSTGQAELALDRLQHENSALQVYHFRAGGIKSVHPIPDAPFVARVVAEKIIFPVLSIVAPSVLNPTNVLARAMLESILKGSSGPIPGWDEKGKGGESGVFTAAEISELAKSSELASS